VFQNHASCIDWLAAHYWEELCEKYPKANLLHSMRDQEKCISSMHKTILPSLLEWDPQKEDPDRENPKMNNKIVIKQLLGCRLEDREHAINVFHAHNHKDRSTISGDRLLVYDVDQGWEPLCEFLEVSVPDHPSPRVNSTEEFQQQRDK
jgi:hypothetical protein